MNWLNACVLLIELNLLWLIGNIVGFFVVGFLPSTLAVMKILNKKDLFIGYYSYSDIFKQFWLNYLSTIRVFKWRILVCPIILAILYVELLMIQQSDLMRALFQWPILLLMSYVILVMLNLILAVGASKEGWRKKALFALASPLLLPKESIVSLLMILSFSILSLAYHWVFFVAISFFLYSASKCILAGYDKKGLLKV